MVKTAQGEFQIVPSRCRYQRIFTDKFKFVFERKCVRARARMDHRASP